MKSIQMLNAEHGTARRMFQIMAQVADLLDAGQPVSTEDIRAITDFLQICCVDLHEGKEERKVFVAIEAAGLHEYRDTISALIREHGQSRQLVGAMVSATREFASDGAAAGRFAAAARGFLALAECHIRLEEETLYPLAEARLTAEQDLAFATLFERMDARELGPDGPAKVARLLERLEQTYPAPVAI
jgi:hemerythrin-like domain-containing protein